MLIKLTIVGLYLTTLIVLAIVVGLYLIASIVTKIWNHKG